jgi:DNA repair exonuclease SbcCD nuclease subunit
MQGADEELAGAMTAIFGGFAASADSIVSNYKIENRPHILVGHWNVAGSKVHGQDYIGHEITIGYDAMMLAQPDLICMGHIHFAQQIKEKLFYNGSIYQKDFGEMEDKGFWLHEFDGKTLTKSTFEQTPHRKLYRDRFDLCAGESIEPSTDGCDSCHVRCEIKVFQDEVDKIDKQIIELIYYDAGAVDVDVRLIRVPRQTVRSELVLNATTLPMKLRAMAILRDETVSATVLLKAEMLENCSPEQISKMVSKGDFIKKENTDAVN